MGTHFIIALAREASVAAIPSSEFPGDLPGIPVERLAHVLEAIPFLHRDGLTFWGDQLEEFELDEENVPSLWFDVHNDAGEEVAAVAAALANSVGPVTLINPMEWVFVEVRPPMTSLDILQGLEQKLLAVTQERRKPQPVRLDPCPKCGRKRATRANACMYCGAKLE